MFASLWRAFWVRSALFLSVLLLPATACRGGLPTADWLPADVKFHLSIVDYPTAKPLFDQTGLGQLLLDKAMLPFLKDIPNQLRSRGRASWLGLMWVDLGVDWNRFASVPGGEVAWAVFEVDESPAAVLFADVTGKDRQLDTFCGEIAAAMAKKNVRPTEQVIDGTTLTLYELPERGEMQAATLVYFVRNGYFVATQHVALAKQMAARAGVQQSDNLSGLASYQYVLSECRKASQNDPHAVLYMVPFDCLEMAHKVATEKDVEIDGSPEVYRSQGFDALAAIGVTILLGGPESDFSFFASLYAPKPWSKSMQMFDLRNVPLVLEKWIDQKIASCSLLNLHAKSVYGNLGPFFDEVVTDGATGAWDEILTALRDEEDGPRIDLENEVLTFLSGPVIVVEAESLPVTSESPRNLLAIKSSNEAKLQAGIEKAMKDDPLILRKDVGRTTCYYSVSGDNKAELLWIICVAHNHLFMANDFDILTPILQQSVGPALANDTAFQRADAGWKKALPANTSTVTFYRLDRWVEVRYELLRQGQKVASRRSLSGMLNSFMGGELMEESKPEIDGSKLPPFNQVRKYFGTLDAAAITVDKGWFVAGHLRPAIKPVSVSP